MGVYDLALVSEEVDRLMRIEFPTHVSSTILKAHVHSGMSVLDVGCGPKPALGLLCSTIGADYLPIDKKVEMVDAMNRGLDAHGLQPTAKVADATALPYGDGSIDFVHMRFVLMHLPFNQRLKAIRECVRVAKHRAIFLEWDWTPMFHVQGNSPIINHFANASLALAELAGANLFMGAVLQSQVLHAVAQSVGRESWGQDRTKDNRGDIIDLCVMGAARADQLRDDSLAEYFRSVGNYLADRSYRVDFQPAEIAQVTVYKS